MPPRWTDKELALLGTDTDSAVADKVGRSPQSVATKRHALGIAPYKRRGRKWTKREIAMLGKMPDAQAARRIGCSWDAIIKKRTKLGIPAYGSR